MRYLISLALLFASCSPNSSEEFQKEGAVRCRLLASELAKIENRQQLLRAEAQLKRDFESLIDLMIEAREVQQRECEIVSAVESGEGALLEEELRRIYAIEGGREIIERAQHEALVRLDAYERTLSKKRAQL